MTVTVWAPEIPVEFDGEWRIDLPAGFAVTEAWWQDILDEHKGRFPEITPDRRLTLREGNPETSLVSTHMTHQIGAWMEAGGGGCGLSSSASFRLPSSARRSGCGSWIAPQRLPVAPRPWRDLGAVVPDLIFDVHPPWLSLRSFQERMVEWIEGGARLGWLIDPFVRKVWIYRANGEVEELDDPAQLSGEDVCDGLVIAMGPVWGERAS